MTDWKDFGSRVVYIMEGWVDEDLDTDEFTRATEASITQEADLTFDEMLYANIINLDSWLHVTWQERMANEIDIGDGRNFIPDWDNVTVSLDLKAEEVIEAAEQRAGEDSSHAAYVLGNWTYLAEKADHIRSPITLRAAFERVKSRADSPDDATKEEYGGGSR